MKGTGKLSGTNCLLVLIGPGSANDPAVAEYGPFDDVMSLEAFARLARSPSFVGKLFRWDRVVALAERIDMVPRPFALATLLRAVSRRSALLIDRHGERRDVRKAFWQAGQRLAADRLAAADDRRRVEALLSELEARGRERAERRLRFERRGPVLMVRTDLWIGVKSGGSVAHTAGVANAFAEEGMAPILLAFETNPILATAVRYEQLPAPSRHWDQPTFLPAAANIDLLNAVDGSIEKNRPALVYHRLASASFAAALAALRRGLPLVIEYNGSEVWIARNWGRGTTHGTFFERIERAVLQSADRIIAVSEPLVTELVASGIRPERVSLQPNGVDAARYRPDANGAAVRRKLGFTSEDKVVGFIGTFGAWHGAPILVESWNILHSRSSVLQNAKLILIGDGPELPQVRRRIEELSLGRSIHLTGLIPQADAPDYLAACDVLISPHVPNADGSAFFGSPTKLFEYMAVGRAIVASRLGQIGEVLADEKTALLVPPGEPAPLADAIARTLTDADLRARLGAAARAEAVAKHSWRSRLADILE